MICLRFRFDPLTRAFSNRYVFDENAQRKGAWTEGLNISKCMRGSKGGAVMRALASHQCGSGSSTRILTSTPYVG